MAINHKSYGILLVVGAAMCFGIAPIVVKIAYSVQLTGWEFASLQLMFSSVILGSLYVIRHNKGLERTPSRQKLIKLVLLGTVGTLGGVVFYNLGLEYLEASVGIVLFYTYPVFTTLGASIFFKEKLKLKHYLCLALTLAGIFLTIDFWNIKFEEISFKGIFLMFSSALCYAFFTLYGEKNLADSSPVEITTFTQLTAFLTLCIIKPPVFLFQGISFDALFLGLIMALFTSVLSYWLFLKGIAIIGASKASIISTAEIPFAIVLAMIILSEKLTLYKFIGATLIICSIIFLDIEEEKDILPVENSS